MSTFHCLNDEVFLANESYAFYTVTNTFRNPIFNCSIADQDLLDGIGACGSGRGDNNAANQSGHDDRGQVSGSQKRSRNKASKSASSTFVLLISQTKEKCSDFCDNFAFALRDKLFIMETNFKRRLRQLTRFINKKLGPIQRHSSSTVTMACNQTGAAPMGHGALDFGQPANELERNCQREFRATRNRREKQRQLFNLSEPLSAEALSIQQERILSRLERMKRANQKLLSSAPDSDNNNNQREESARRRCGGRLPKSASSGAASGNSNGSQMTVPIWLRSASSGCAISSPLASWPPAHARSGSFSNTTPEEDNEDDGDQVGACNLTTTSQLDADKAAPRPATAEEATTTTRSAVATTSRKGDTSGRWSSISNGVRRHTKRCKTRVEADSADEKKTCIVCYERPPNILTLPCEHSDICSDCFIEIIYMAVKNSEYPLRCVLCRQKIERIRCSRRLMLSVIKRNRKKSANNSLLSL